MLAVHARRTACNKAKTATAAARGISARAACCSYYRGRAGGLDRPCPLASKASGRRALSSSRHLHGAASVRPGFKIVNLSSGGVGDAPHHGAIATAVGGAAGSSGGRARRKSTAALMEENDNDVETGPMVGGEADGGGSLTSFRLTGERE